MARVTYVRPDTNTRHNTLIEYERLKPIQLTDEVLRGLGFEKITKEKQFVKDKKVFGNKWLQLNKIGNGFDAYFFEPATNKIGAVSFNGNALQHLHELQNLYFALTGEEINN